MSATVFGAAQYGAGDDLSATGLKLSNYRASSSTDRQDAEDHTGSVFAFSLTNDRTEISADGVVAVKGTGMGVALSDVVALTNATLNGLNLEEDGLFTTVDTNAGTVVTDMEVSRQNKTFENGSFSGVFFPLVATNSPATVSS